MKKSIIFLMTIFVAGFAQDVKKDSVNYYFNPVVITANKFEGAQREIAASVSVLDQQVIEKATTRSVIELVEKRVPGVSITSRAVMGYGVAAGAAGGINIRGVGGSPVTGVLVLRDGRPDIMGMMGHPLPDAYSLDGVEKIEVVRGPASFLYGTNAMGGVINIVSKKVRQEGMQTTVQAGMGNYGSQKLSARHGGKFGKFDYYVTAATRNSDGHRDFADYDGDFFTAHAGYRFSESTSLRINANYSDVFLHDPGPISTPYENHWYDIERSGADVSLVHNSRLGESNIKLHGNFGQHRIYDGWRSNDRTVGVMFYHNASLWNGNTSTLGFDYKNYGGDAEDSINKSPVTQYGEKFVTEYAPYVHSQQLLLDRFVVSAGLRLEQHEIYGQELLPKFGLVTHLGKAASVRLSAVKGFRSPSIRELYVFLPRNEELKPEKMWNYEAGLNYELGERASVDLAVFTAQVENMILLQGPPPLFYNSGSFDYRGYEISLQWLPLNNLDVSMAYSGLNTERAIPNSPESKATVHLGYQIKRLYTGFDLMYVSGLYGVDSTKPALMQSPLALDNYALVDISARYNLVKNIGLTLSLKNALDSDYQTLYGYPMPGRTFMSEINYSF